MTATRSFSMPLSMALRSYSENWSLIRVSTSPVRDANTFPVDAYGRSRVFHITNGVNVSISGLPIISGQATSAAVASLTITRR